MTTTILVVVGSVRAGRIGDRIARWFVRYLEGCPDVVPVLFDLADALPSPTMEPDAGADGLGEAIDGADAVVLVTPEYNHGVPGPLKTAVDAVKDPWRGKPIGLVSYGGASGGLRAVEAWRLVFAELHAVTVRDAVSVPMAWQRLDGDRLHDDAPHSDAADRMVAQLRWWAAAVHAAGAYPR